MSYSASSTSRLQRLGPLGRTILEAAGIIAFKWAFDSVRLGAHRTAHSNTIVSHLRDAHQEGKSEYLFHALLLILFAAILAPLIEELAFRGLPILILRWLERKKPFFATSGVSWAIGVLTAIGFTVGHESTSILDAMPHFVFGLVAWNAARTRGLRYSILLHTLNNAFYAVGSIILIASMS